jgi:hypothetical protein
MRRIFLTPTAFLQRECLRQLMGFGDSAATRRGCILDATL